ncbi:MAG: sulfatase-like hydrolase/transferase, partial [Gemmatimonadetes bacterium]|nr:sulfatase-like hydrolase/transferase [Gemmatimonadota bacterium]
MTTQPPNIVLIVTDQQRGDALSLAGHPALRTPNLDFIGATGTRFRRAYSEVPSCIPARHVLMSGQSPETVGMLGFYYRNATCPWTPESTLPGTLHDAGYETRMVGKLHLQPQRQRFGFDAMELADGVGGENDYVDWLRQRGVPRHLEPAAHGIGSCSWLAKPHHLREEQTYPAWAVDRSLDFLRKRDPSTPFFLNLSIFSPHPPLTPSTAYFDHYDRMQLGDLGEPDIGDWVEPFDGPINGLDPVGGEQRVHLDPLTMHRCRAGYFGLIHELDAQIGRLLSALRGQLENTVILFTSDHGEMLGDHHLFGKCEPFEGSANVPFLLRLPGPAGKTPDDGLKGQICDRPVGLQDVMPTLLDLAGITVPDACTGRSVAALARGEQSADWRDCLHGEHSGYRTYEEGFHYLVDDRYKYIWRSQTGQELLFDLMEDPCEEHDLSQDADITTWRRRMAKQLAHRPEGFSDGEQLIAGQPHRAFVPGKGPEVAW